MSIPVVAASSASNFIAATSGPVMANSCGTLTTGAQFGTYIPQRIFVGGIPRETTEAELKTFFSNHGAVKDSKIITDKAGASKGYAFITFEKQEDAEKLSAKDGDPIYFRNRKLNIGPAVKRHITSQPTPTVDSRDSTPVYLGNGLGYAYQNQLALLHHPTAEENYGLAAPTPNSSYSTGAVVVPQPQATYINPTAAYSYPFGAATAQWLPATGHWGLSSSAAASTPYVSANPTYYYANYPGVQYAPEVLYAHSTAAAAAHPYSLESSQYYENYQLENSASDNMDTSSELSNEFLQPQSPPPPAMQTKATLIAYPRCAPAMALNPHHHYQNMLIKQPKKGLAIMSAAAPQTILQKSFSDTVDNIGNLLLTPPPTPSTNTK